MRFFRSFSKARAALAFTPLILAKAIAQPVLEPALPPAGPDLPPVVGPDGLPVDPVDRDRVSGPANATSVFAGAAPVLLPGRESSTPFRLGPVDIHPHADYTFTYGNGVSTAPGTQRTTAQHRIVPGIFFQTDHLSLDYSPSLNYYSDDAFENHLDHTLYFLAQYALGDWQFRLSQIYSRSGSPLVETGAQTQQETFNTSLGATYRYTDTISFDLGLDQQIQSTEGFNNSREWSTTDWANYHFSDNSSVGLGVALGFVDVSRGSDMTFERVLARLSSRFTEKLSAELSGGAEFRQFVDEPGSDRVNPIMNARLSYIPWEPTAVSLMASRSVETSLFEGFVTETSQIQALLQQRLLGRFYLDLSGGFRISEMEGGTTPGQAGRSDDLLTLSAALRANFLTHGSASVFYRRSDNSSSTELFSFDSDQYGFQVGYRF